MCPEWAASVIGEVLYIIQSLWWKDESFIIHRNTWDFPNLSVSLRSILPCDDDLHRLITWLIIHFLLLNIKLALKLYDTSTFLSLLSITSFICHLLKCEYPKMALPHTDSFFFIILIIITALKKTVFFLFFHFCRILRAVNFRKSIKSFKPQSLFAMAYTVWTAKMLLIVLCFVSPEYFACSFHISITIALFSDLIFLRFLVKMLLYCLILSQEAE